MDFRQLLVLSVVGLGVLAAATATVDDETVLVLERGLDLILTRLFLKTSPGRALPPPPIECDLCKILIGQFRDALRSNETEAIVDVLTINWCMKQKIFGGSLGFCSGMVREYGHEVIYVLTERFLDPPTVCQFLGACARPGADLERDRMRKLSAQGTHPSRYSTRYVPTPSAKDNDDVGTFVQLTDIHLDSRYAIGSNADCPLPTCCRAGESGPVKKPAGKWGSYLCDTPPQLLAALVSSLQGLEVPPDFVLWTGDDPPHDVWEQSRENNLAAAKNVTAAVKEAFGSGSIPVYPALGNHESFPCDQFEGPPYDNWLYPTLASYWSGWLDTDAQEEFSKAGFYSTTIKPGLRLVSLNTMYADIVNFWNIMQFDPADQLSWLADTLASARSNGEKVYIIGHIPIGNNWFAVGNYSESVHALCDEYRDVILAMFFGHTHQDSFTIVRDIATNTEPLFAYFTAPSVTTSQNINPSYRQYVYNRTTFEVLDYVQFSLNLTNANLNNNLTFVPTYSWRNAYNASSLRAQDVQAVVEKMAVPNSAEIETACIHYVTGHDPRCDAKTQRKLACIASSADSKLFEACVG